YPDPVAHLRDRRTARRPAPHRGRRNDARARRGRALPPPPARYRGARSALRLRDIVVRDAHGTVVASAPKAEVGVSSLSLLTGRVQTERLSLIGAEMALRTERGGQINILAGAGKPALAVPPTVTSSIATAAVAAPGEQTRLPPVEVTSNPLSAILAWIDRLDSLGLDGGSLSEIGLKDCTLV